MKSRLRSVPGVSIVLCAVAAVGCSGGSGGQSFDDGSGDFGRGRRTHVDGASPGAALAERPSTSIVASPATYSPPTSDWNSGSIAFVGDIDSDGYSDFIIQMPRADGYRIHAIYGRSEFPAELSIEDADFTISGASYLSVIPLGDFNGDGFDDLVLEDSSEFDVRVMLGSRTRRSGLIAAETLETVIARDPAHGTQVSRFQGPGDVNGDGFADLLLSYVTSSELVLGREEPAWGTVEVGSRASLSVGARMARVHEAPRSDLDGDGLADIVVVSDDGTALYYGRVGEWSSATGSIEPDALLQGWVHGFRDWNDDGYDDVAQVVDRATFVDGPDAAMQIARLSHEVLLSSGGPQRWEGSVELPRPPLDTYYSLAARVALGDLNGDGRHDLLLGSPFNPMGLDGQALEAPAGGIFFVPGTEDSTAGALVFDEDAAILRGRSVGETGDHLGLAVSANGDANGDGFDDALILRQARPDDPLMATLIFGGEDL